MSGQAFELRSVMFACLLLSLLCASLASAQAAPVAPVVAPVAPAPAAPAPAAGTTTINTTTNNAAPSSAATEPEEHGADMYLRARCASALCFDPDKWIGIEPLVELPIAKSFATGGGSLAQYINNHSIGLQLAAGLRVWLFRDLVSFSIYLSLPISDAGIRVVGSEFTYPGSSIRRPYPGFAVGLLYDILWLGLDHDELRNGDSSNAAAYNPEYPANHTVSSCTTISVALQPVTAVRALFGLVQDSRGK